MQQVAASTKDIAAPALFPGDPVTSDVTGAGADFAKVMESQSADSGEQSYRGHGDFFDSPENPYKGEVSLEEGATKEVTIGDDFSDAPAELPGDESLTGSDAEKLLGDGKAQAEQAEQDELHEEWISIIQKLNGDKDKLGGDKEVTLPNPEDDLGRNISSLPGNKEQQTDELEQESLADEQLIAEQAVVTDNAQWKEELKQKLLSAGQQFNSQQVQSVEKEIGELTDAEIQQLLNDDQALKQMLSEIMDVQEPDPQDVALLMALAGEGQSDIQSEELADSDVNPELIANTQTSEHSDGSEAENEQSDIASDLLDEPLAANTTAEEQPLPEVSTEQATNVASNTEVKADPQLELEKQLNQLDAALKTDEQKVATLENLTRRVESSEVAQTPAGKSFIESMKGATAEFKEQLKGGHEPGININKLVTEAVNAGTGNAEAVALETQVQGAVQKIADVAQSHLNLEPGARDNLVSSFQSSLNSRESSVAQLEAGKNQQQNLQNQLMDKAVNINKPEAAQDLGQQGSGNDESEEHGG